MKEKIEELIKEIGINEVESILKQIKSKVNIKEKIKEDFIDLLTGCNIIFDISPYKERRYIEYYKDNNKYFYYKHPSNEFGVNYDIYKFLNKKYGIDSDSSYFDRMISDIVGEVLNYKNTKISPYVVIHKTIKFK